MKIRKATTGDLPELMNIFTAAKGIMRASGNHEQWNNGYPTEEIVRHDIETGVCHVACSAATGEILATMAFIPGPDPTYSKIYNGQWLDEDPYCVIHRIAVAAPGMNLARRMLDWAFGQCGNIRIDTHSDNCIMHHILQAYGFTHCGTIYLANGDPREAYQLTK